MNAVDMATKTMKSRNDETDVAVLKILSLVEKAVEKAADQGREDIFVTLDKKFSEQSLALRTAELILGAKGFDVTFGYNPKNFAPWFGLNWVFEGG